MSDSCTVCVVQSRQSKVATNADKIMLNQILSTCKQLNRLLKTKDPYHSDMVSTLLAKIEKQLPSDSPKGLDRDVIIKALNDKADR